MKYQVLVEHVEGGWVATVFDAEKHQIATEAARGRMVAIERAKFAACEEIDDEFPVWKVQELSE